MSSQTEILFIGVAGTQNASDEIQWFRESLANLCEHRVAILLLLLVHYLDSFVIHAERSIGAYHETFEFLESDLGILVRLFFSGQFCGCVISPGFDILLAFSQ